MQQVFLCQHLGRLFLAWGSKVLESMAEQRGPVGPKRRKLQAEEDITAAVKRGEVSEQTLLTRLTEYVERIDTDLVCPRFADVCIFPTDCQGRFFPPRVH